MKKVDFQEMKIIITGDRSTKFKDNAAVSCS